MNINNRYQILTPNGYEDFYGIQEVIRDKYVVVYFSDETKIECSIDHVFLSGNEEFKAKDLLIGDYISSKKGFKIVEKIEFVEDKIKLYDIINSGKNNIYYTNDVLSHNCLFDGSSNTLLNGVILDKLIPVEPLRIQEIYKKDYELKIYYEPIPDHSYILTVDPSEGLGLDYTGIHIFDISKKNKRIQVATLYCNTLSIPEAPFVISAIGKLYNNAMIIGENNKCDVILRDILEKTEYEGDLYIHEDGRLGLRTTQFTRNVSLKQLEIEFKKDRFEINDYETIHELNCFIEKNGKLQAEEGQHDDLVMSMSMLGYIISDSMLYERYIESNERYMKDVFDMDDDQLDFFIDDGVDTIRLNDRRNIYDEYEDDDDMF